MLKALLNDEAGFVVSTELVLVATILVIGLIVGQTTLRDSVVAEIADTAESIGNINQSYEFGNITGHSSSTAGSGFADAPDFCEDTTGTEGTQGLAGGNTCVSISGGAVGTDAQGTETDEI